MPAFVPRQRKHKVKQRLKDRQHGHSHPPVEDSNAAELLPAHKEEREARRRQARQELAAQQPKMSRKKQKRLDKYIETKLKKEDNLELMKKLAATKTDVSLLRSSKNLGATRDSRRDVYTRALKEREAGINVVENEAVLFADRPPNGVDEEDDEEENSTDIDSIAVNEIYAEATNGDRKYGSGHLATPSDLGRKRAVEEESGEAISIQNKRQKMEEAPNILEPEWEGFDTETSSNEATIELPATLTSEKASSSIDSSDDSVASEVDPDPTSSSSVSPEFTKKDAERKQRASAFKAWADQQRNEVIGYEPVPSHFATEKTKNGISLGDRFQPRPVEQDPLPQELKITNSDRKAFHVPVERNPELAAARLALPVVAEEQKIMEAIYNNPVVIVWGATGSGKTTQVPQFLYEAGFGNPRSPNPGLIGITQPRRVAAVSMASRVGEELGNVAGKVAYKIRFEGSVSENTAIKYMTDGILLREASEDIILRRYSAIIIDEAHERSKDTDILIGMMSRIVKLRLELSKEDESVQPLKLVIMSATLRTSDFAGNKQLFRIEPPVVQAEGRQHPVTLHWSKKTSHDYVDEAYRKICKGHRRLPPGGMLVFLTGQNEIAQLRKRLMQAFSSKAEDSATGGHSVVISSKDAPFETEDVDLGSAAPDGHVDHDSDDEVALTGLDNDLTDEDDDDDDFDVGEAPTSDTAMHILPLYSLLPTKEQLRVFDPPPEGSRLVVISTNVAETSLTIPGISYVFDCGRAKERRYDDETGVQRFEIGWISKASAGQRAGRAGRTGPGHCYRLYSSAVFERDFPEHTPPEILRTPIEGIVLQLTSLNVPNILDKFPFPTPPDPRRLAKAQKLLSYLGALTPKHRLTPLGHQMSTLPLFPRHAKILLTGNHHSCLPYTIALVAALSVPDIFIPQHQLDLSPPPRNASPTIFTTASRLEEDAREARRTAYNRAHYHFSRLGGGASDALKLLSAVIEYDAAPDKTAFCATNFLRSKALHETHLLRRQLTHLLKSSDSAAYAALPDPSSTKNHTPLPTPSSKQLKALTHALAAGFVDQVAIRADAAPHPPPPPMRKSSKATHVPYLPLFPVQSPTTTTTADDNPHPDPAVYIHPSSALAHTAPKSLPLYVIYSHLQHSSAPAPPPTTDPFTGAVTQAPPRPAKIRVHPLTPLSATLLAALTSGTPLVDEGKPVKEVSVRQDTDGNAVAVLAVRRRDVWYVPRLRVPKSGALGWVLPAVRRRERWVGGRWVGEGEGGG
ncbi:MAG: putative ATP-dependent RNA helicase DHR1 [Piccolia ochrophora]|nr:MAG: putative ATP-dependent RNA helicase DHR1 [Piccolia ochrophora]